MADIINSNIFLVGGNGFGKPPLIFSSFIKAEGELLGQLRKAASRGERYGFMHTITCVQIDTNTTRETVYSGSITPGKYRTTLRIVRDKDNRCGCKAVFTERLLLSLDYVNVKGKK